MVWQVGTPARHAQDVAAAIEEASGALGDVVLQRVTGHTSVGKLLSLSSARLREARAELVAAGLIAHRAPFYQVLNLEPMPAPPPALPTSVAPPRAGETLSAADILRAIWKEEPK